MTPFPGFSIIVGVLFGVFVATTVLGALIAALSPRVIRGVCGLAMCCIGLAGIFYFLHSPFLALMEVLIYVGAVCVTIVFVIMLAETEESAQQERRRAAVAWGAGALLVSALIFWSLSWLGLQEQWTSSTPRVTDGSVKAIGVSLLTTYCMAFELISLVLLVAILGALAIARPGRTKE